MPVTRAAMLSRRLLPSVPGQIAAQLADYDWRTAQVVERGKDHTILIADDLAVARIPRQLDPDLDRKMQLLNDLDLPWLVPTPLSEVEHGVLQTYLPGTAHPHGSGEPHRLADIVSVFEAYNTADLGLNVPFAQRGRITRQKLKHWMRSYLIGWRGRLPNMCTGGQMIRWVPVWCMVTWPGTTCIGSTTNWSAFWIGIMRPTGIPH